MGGKLIPLLPRAREGSCPAGNPAWEELSGLLQPELGGVETCLFREVERAPQIIKDDLREKLAKGERFCAALFLAFARDETGETKLLTRMAAALEALHLALEVHCTMEAGPGAAKQWDGPILEGDYLYSLALTLAADSPLFIKGMAEIIARSVASEVNLPPRRAPWALWRRHLLARMSSRSASIAALSSSLGGWQAGLSPSRVEAATYFGHYLGMARRLRGELQHARQELEQRSPRLLLALPVVYLLEISAKHAELSPLLYKSRCTPAEKEILIQEWEKADPDTYINTLAKSCLEKARRSRGLLEEQGEAPILDYLLRTAALV